mmetsp:Transcript_81616/g.263425  ORF Transcript_81616/g.263425 Transcript_81616/m.263425 type:complete len:471 (-) Transcript_81616:152-1564(-)
MGVCALCCNAPPPGVCLEGREALIPKKLRPLLFDLENAFFEHAGEDQVLDAGELADIWKKESLKKSGKLSDEDLELIEKGAKEMIHHMDADSSGKVSYAEFVAHSMGGTEARGALRDMRKNLNAELKKNPNKLQELIEKFKAWDKNQDGFVTPEEIEAHLEELCAEGGMPNDIAFASKLKDELLAVADVDSDGKVDLWELMAWALGRRKQPVELILYDISKGATEWAGPLLFGRFDVEAFHSALLVYNSEYWYGGKVFRSEPPCSKQFGMPITQSRVLNMVPSEVRPDLCVVKMGHTFVAHEEYVKFLQEKVIDRYTGLQKYDLLTHSCNHFSDESLHFLLGHGVPAHVLALQNMVLTPTVIAIRPFLNQYLGGFSEMAGGGDQLLEDTTIAEGAGKLQPRALLGEGAVVMVDGGAAGIDAAGSCVIATIVRESAEKCDIRYFDANEQKVVTREGIPSKAITKRVEDVEI